MAKRKVTVVPIKDTSADISILDLLPETGRGDLQPLGMPDSEYKAAIKKLFKDEKKPTKKTLRKALSKRGELIKKIG